MPDVYKRQEGYSEAYMEQVLARIDEILTEDSADAPAAAVQPNIIVAQSESFYDLTRLPGLQYERDPLENFHALESEGISGTFHSHYLGYGTGYLEMSMLYGITAVSYTHLQHTTGSVWIPPQISNSLFFRAWM